MVLWENICQFALLKPPKRAGTSEEGLEPPKRAWASEEGMSKQEQENKQQIKGSKSTRAQQCFASQL